jgi:cellulose biosynthesis protein BcsQ
MDTLDRKPRANDLTNYRTWSPTSTPKGRFKYLQAVSVIASDREAWHDLDDRLRTISAAQVAAGWELLRKALAAVQDSFDVCLIDFPACYTGPITKNGIAAADWWLFPIEPNRMATRDLDSTRHLVQTVRKGINKPIHGLGTLLNRCQSRNTKEFKRSKEVLAKLAQKKTIPRLFSPASELLERTDAMEALDDTLAGGFNTIAQKYGGGPGTPLHQNLVSLTKEILQRLRIQMTAAVEVDTSRDINAEATKTYQAV